MCKSIPKGLVAAGPDQQARELAETAQREGGCRWQGAEVSVLLSGEHPWLIVFQTQRLGHLAGGPEDVVVPVPFRVARVVFVSGRGCSVEGQD